jgi:hypothetical protein
MDRRAVSFNIRRNDDRRLALGELYVLAFAVMQPKPFTNVAFCRNVDRLGHIWTDAGFQRHAPPHFDIWALCGFRAFFCLALCSPVLAWDRGRRVDAD